VWCFPWLNFGLDWWKKLKASLDLVYGRLFGAAWNKLRPQRSTPPGGIVAGPLVLPLKAHRELKMLWESLRSLETLDYLPFHALSHWNRIQQLALQVSAPPTRLNTSDLTNANTTIGTWTLPAPLPPVPDVSVSSSAIIFKSKPPLYGTQLLQQLYASHQELSRAGNWTELELLLTDLVRLLKLDRLQLTPNTLMW